MFKLYFHFGKVQNVVDETQMLLWLQYYIVFTHKI
jgi:hypothetical protein